MKKLLFAATAILALAVAPAVKASPITPFGTFGFAGLGGTSFTGSTIGSATSVTIPAGIFINNTPATYLGHPNIFVPIDFTIDSSAVNPTTLSVSNINGAPVTYGGVSGLVDYLTWTGSGDTYFFTLNSGTWTSSASTNLSFVGLGTFTDLNGTYISGPAEISLGFTNTGSTNYSGTFEVPPPPKVPEPSSLVLLGSGLLGAAFFLFRRKRSAANIAA